MKKALYAGGALLVLLLAAALLAPVLIDVNDYKPRLLAEVKKATGRDLAIDGPIGLSLLPTPELSVEDVRLANLPGSQEPDMVRVKAMRVSVALLPLLSRRVEIRHIELIEPRIVLEVLPDGRANWAFGEESPAAAPTPPAQAEGAAGTGPAIGVRNLAVKDGTLIYRDARSGRSQQLDKVDARLVAGSFDSGPFDLDLAFASGDVPAALTARLGEKGNGGIPVFLSLKLAGGQASFSGTVSELAPAAALSGTFKAGGDNLANVVQAAAALAGSTRPDLPPLLGQKFSVDAQLAGTASDFAARGMKLALGEDDGSGDLAVRLEPTVKADLKLAFTRLDLDRLLVQQRPVPPGDKAAPAAAAPVPASSAGTGKGGGFVLPADLEATLDLAAQAVSYRGGAAQQVALKADLAKGTLTVRQAGALLPGGTTAALSGTLSTPDGQPAIGGRVEVKGARLRELLGWLQVDVGGIPADRLNNFSFTGQLAASPEGSVQITNGVLQVDATTARGSLTLRTQPKLMVGANLDIDSLNADAYLPKPAAPARQAPAAPAAEKAGGTAPSAAGIDANLKARVARLTYLGNPVEGVDVDVVMAGDKLTFRNTRVASLAGAAVALSGTVSSYATSPSFDLNIDLKTQDVERLLRLAGVESPLKDQRIGAVTAKGGIAGKPDDLAFRDFSIAALGATARLTGRLQPAGPAFDFSKLELRTDDADRLLSLAGIASPLAGRKLGPLTLSGAAAGSLDQLKLDLNASVLTVGLDLNGTIAGLKATPVLALDVGVAHADFGRFMQVLLPGYGGGAGVGPVKLQARLDGSPGKELKIANLRGNIGSAAIAGSVAANLAGPVPRLTASLETGALALDAILPVQRKAALEPGLRSYPDNVIPAGAGTIQLAQAARAPARGGRFSREPIDVSALRSIDAAVSLKSQALSMDPWRVDNAVAELDLKGGVLTVTRLTGKAFNGDFSLTGVLNAAKLPAAMEARLAVARMDMARLSHALSQRDRFEGVLSVDMALRSGGGSQAELVSNLAGNGKVDGSIRVNASLKEQLMGVLAGQAAKGAEKLLGKVLGSKNRIDLGAGDINAAIRVALERFANRNGPVAGEVTIDRGVAVARGLRVTGDRAHADIGMTASLPQWTLESTTNVFLAENPRQPYLIVTAKGPLDDPGIGVDRNAAYKGDAAKGDAPKGDAPKGDVPRGEGETGAQQPGQPGAPQPAQPQPQAQPEQPQQPAKPKKPNVLDLLKKKL